MVQNRERKLNIIELTFIIFLIAGFILNGFVAVPFYYLMALEAAYIVFAIFSTDLNKALVIKMIAIVFFIALLYTILTDTVTIDMNDSNYRLKRFVSKLSQYGSMFFPLILFKRVMERANRKQINLMILFAVLFLLIYSKSILDTIAIDPLAGRYFGDENFAGSGGRFIAAYYFVYGSTFAFLAAALLFFFNPPLHKIIRIIALIIAVFWGFFILKTQFTLAMITSIISLGILFFRTHSDKNSRIVFICSLVLIVTCLPLLLKFMIGILPDILAQRLSEVLNVMQGGSAGDSDDFLGRLNLYWKTILAFLSSPIVGNRTLPFDGHATFLCVWADIGVFGGISLFYLLRTAKKIVVNILGDSGYYFIPFYIHILMNGFTNPIHSSTVIDMMLWFITPLVIYNYISNNEAKLQN